MREAQAEAVEAKRERAKRKAAEEPGPGDAVRTDEDGIPFHTLQKEKPAGLVDETMGITRWPMWTGKLWIGADGKPQPKIVQVPVAENINGGRGLVYYQGKGFKSVTEIPDKYAEYRDPYVEAVKAKQAEDKRKAEIRKQLAEAGVRVPGYKATTSKNLTALVGGHGGQG